MNTINFINPHLTVENRRAYGYLVTCVISGFRYSQAKQELEEYFNTYVPEDQYNAFVTVLDIQMNLDIGPRKEERS